MTQAEYLSRLEYTGRQIRTDKRGTIAGPAAVTLARDSGDALAITEAAAGALAGALVADSRGPAVG